VSIEEQPRWKERGWLIPYLMAGDDVFGVGRLNWWIEGMAQGRLPDGGIPKIEFRNSGSHDVRDGLQLTPYQGNKENKAFELSAHGARSHIEHLVQLMRGGWDSLVYLVRWLHFGLGLSPLDSEAPEAPYDANWGHLLYAHFELGRLQAADCDVFGDIIAESKSKGFNPGGFYPTPQSLVHLMTQMTFGDMELEEGRDPRTASVCDPCVGTGRMLLEASNYSFNLFGQDVDALMVEVCAINLAIYAPWGVYIDKATRELLGRGNGEAYQRSLIKQMDEARVEQGHQPATPESEDFEFNSHGQGELFSFS